jgi:hypothetical protein
LNGCSIPGPVGGGRYISGISGRPEVSGARRGTTARWSSWRGSKDSPRSARAELRGCPWPEWRTTTTAVLARARDGVLPGGSRSPPCPCTTERPGAGGGQGCSNELWLIRLAPGAGSGPWLTSLPFSAPKSRHGLPPRQKGARAGGSGTRPPGAKANTLVGAVECVASSGESDDVR